MVCQRRAPASAAITTSGVTTNIVARVFMAARQVGVNEPLENVAARATLVECETARKRRATAVSARFDVMTLSDLRKLLDETLASDVPHVERLTISAAVISEVLRARGMQATLVGGGAIEFYASEVYTTTDLDLVVEGPREAVDAAFTEFGFSRRGRHWVMRDLSGRGIARFVWYLAR